MTTFNQRVMTYSFLYSEILTGNSGSRDSFISIIVTSDPIKMLSSLSVMRVTTWILTAKQRSSKSQRVFTTIYTKFIEKRNQKSFKKSSLIAKMTKSYSRWNTNYIGLKTRQYTFSNFSINWWIRKFF